MGQSVFTKTRIVEFDWLKMLALLLIIFVHSDLYFVFPEIIFPVQWFLVSCFFFVSGFLSFDSFYKYGASIWVFFKTKILKLYVPFVAVFVFYFALQIIIGVTKIDLVYLLSSVTLLNIFDFVNAIYNWDFLWFIPYLLVFMIIFCFMEKYVKNPKLQVLLVLFLWFYTILVWTYNAVFKPGQVFPQYFLVFMVGVWLNKLKMYERVMRFRTGFIMVPLVVLFSLNLSNLFTFNNSTEILKYLFYSNGRSVIFSLSAVLSVLLFLRKFGIPRNRFVELIAKTSILIYFMEPFFSYILRNYVFGQSTIYFATGLNFYLYIITRIVVLFLFLPLGVKAVKNYLKNGILR